MATDVSKINDLNLLKAMAYDALAQKQMAEQNLVVINQRIEEVSAEQIKLPPGKTMPNGVKPNRATRRKKK